MARNVLVDTGFVVALLSRRDRHHRWAALQAPRHAPPWRTCDAVLSEAFYLLGTAGDRALAAMLRRGALVPAFDLATELDPVLALMRKYANVPMSLADACRVLRSLPKADLDRYGKYRDCLQRGLQFVAGLQYAKENLRHFEPKFAEAIEGGFYVSGQDGNIRIEQTAWAVSAIVQFFQAGAARD